MRGLKSPAAESFWSLFLAALLRALSALAPGC